MKLNNTILKVIFLFLVSQTGLFAGYTIDRGYTTNDLKSCNINNQIKLIPNKNLKRGNR